MNPMEQNPSWEANRSSANQKNLLHFKEFEGSLLNPQAPALVPILNQITLFHASQSNLLKIHFQDLEKKADIFIYDKQVKVASVT
jgi:hypothetical protein